MARGLPYDSEQGRAYGRRHHRAHDRAGLRHLGARSPPASGPFAGYAAEPRADARRHRASTARRSTRSIPAWCRRRCWRPRARSGNEAEDARAASTASATPRSPCSPPPARSRFMMDCDTTGVEPDIALVKYKKLVGGGMLKIVNHTVPEALEHLGYSAGRSAARSSTTSRSTRRSRGRPHLQAGAPAGLRLRLPAAERHALHPLHGPRPDDGGGAAVPLRRDLQDGQHARRGHRRGDRATSTSRPGSWGSRRSPSTATAASAPSRSTPAARAASDRRGGAPATAAAARPADRRRAVRRRLPDERQLDHAQVLDRRPRGLRHGRAVRGRHARRDLHRHGQGGQRRLRADGLLRHRRSRSRCSTACRSRSWSTSSSTSRFEPSRLHRQPGDPLSPSRSPTTSSAGWP